MKRLLIAILMSLSSQGFAQAVVDVTLTPMGDFKLKSSAVKGVATVVGDTVKAENIVVDLRGLTTGMKVRDGHAKDYLQVDKHPEAILVKGEGKGGQGTGTIRIRGVEQTVKGTYEIKGGKVFAKFPLRLSKFGITGISYKGVGVEDDVTVEVAVPKK